MDTPGGRNKSEEEEMDKNSIEKDLFRKNFYLSWFAHEIKTPINTIAGFSQLLKESDNKKENIRKYLDIITETSESMISIINYFNEIVEIETGSVSVIPDEINLNEFIDELYRLHYPLFIEKNIRFEKNVKLDKNLIIISDEAKLKQILRVLILNSLHYTFSGKADLCCEVRNDNLLFTVSDTGSGIPDDLKKTIFETSIPESSMVKRSKGTGLGLIISKAYIEMLGGKIWFESVEGKGSSFYFEIPLKVSGKSSGPEITDEKKPVQGSAKKRILVAEDDNLNFLLIKSILLKLNTEIIRAENGKDAVDLFRSGHADLILMDIRMPVMDGYTAAKLIKEIDPSVRIIAQTAYSNDKSIALSNGCDDFIAKPYSMNHLLKMVTSYL